MVGFIGKFAIFHSLVTAGGPWMIGLLVIAGINTAISLIYYLRVAKVVCIDPEPMDRGPVSIGLVPAVYVLVVAVPVIIYGILPSRILEFANAASATIVDVKPPTLPFSHSPHLLHALTRYDQRSQPRAGDPRALVPAIFALRPPVRSAGTREHHANDRADRRRGKMRWPNA